MKAIAKHVGVSQTPSVIGAPDLALAPPHPRPEGGMGRVAQISAEGSV